MAITRVCYTTREQVKQALDIKWTARMDPQVDAAIQSATESVEGLLHRVFYPTITTRYWDWPNFQYAYPWRVWFDKWELAATPTSVATGGTAIPTNAINFEPINSGPPYTYMELQRNLSYGFGVGPTPQRDIAITGPFGYWANTTPAGALAVAMSDTTGVTSTVTNGAAVGVGDHFLVDSERVLVADKASVTTGQAQQGSGCSTTNVNDVALGVTDGTKYSVGETLTLDTERMLVVDVLGNTLTVKRAWDGTTIATHSGATIYAQRLLTVQRGILGTTAATHAQNAVVNRAVYPGMVGNLSLGEALVEVKQQLGAYAMSQGSGPSKVSNIGQGLDDLRDRCYARYGRKTRIRAV